MARKKSGGDGGNAILVIFLVVFALAAIALGVMYYTGQEKVAAAEAEKTKAAGEIATARKAQTEAELKAKMYKVFVGTATDGEKADVQSNSNGDHAAALRAEHALIMSNADGALKTAVDDIRKGDNGRELDKLGFKFDLKANEVFTWKWDAGGALDKQPTPGPVLDRVARVVAERERTFRVSEVQRKAADKQATDYTKAKNDYVAALNEAKGKIDEQIKKLDAAIAVVEADKKVAIKTFEDKSEETRKEIAKRQAIADEVTTEMKATRETLGNVQKQLESELARRDAVELEKKGAFAVNLPHGAITKRASDKMVEIDLGSNAGLKPGQTFTIQPSSTRTEGLGRQKKQQYLDGRLVVSDELASKGTIEVVKVNGPNEATARITYEDDPNRDSILKGDLLYNPLFKKNAKDHLVLVGIFDTNGDGIDDIAEVARDLGKRGAIVDGYFDLSTNKWESLDPMAVKPGPGANTTYVVRGWDFDSVPGSPLEAAKGNLRTQINTAVADARNKGAQEVRAVKFLSEIGYPLSPSISDQTVTESAIKYLGQVAAPGPEVSLL